jgi:hypothetical protein
VEFVGNLLVKDEDWRRGEFARYQVRNGYLSEYPDLRSLLRQLEGRVKFETEGGSLRMIRVRGSISESERSLIDLWYYEIYRIASAAAPQPV